MHYEFAIIRTKYSISKRKLFYVITFVICFILPVLFFSYFMNEILNGSIRLFILSLFIPVFIFFCLCYKIIDKYVIIGTLVLINNKLVIEGDKFCEVYFEDINFIRFHPELSGLGYIEQQKSYKIYITTKNEIHVTHISRNQFKYGKIIGKNIFNKEKDIFDIFKLNGIKYGFTGKKFA